MLAVVAAATPAVAASQSRSVAETTTGDGTQAGSYQSVLGALSLEVPRKRTQVMQTN